MERFVSMLVAVLVLVGWSGTDLADHVKDGRQVHKMVFQMNEDNPKLWNLMLNNINNVINELGKENVDIKVVTYGPGINMFRKDRSDVQARLDSLKKFAGKGVDYRFAPTP
jgi:intracellular sulfur oxidation DsrE/DsrF family protein